MPTVRRMLALSLVILLVAACGGGTGDTTTSIESTTTIATTTTEATTTTVDTGPLAPLLTAPVADPLLDTGFHTMRYVDDGRAYLVSEDSITGASPDVERLAVGLLQPPPAVTGVAPDQMLVSVWIDGWSGDPMPTGVVLYTRGPDGWSSYATLHSDRVMAFLETTTDYNARKPTGTPLPVLTVTEFEWSGGSARVVAGVSVFAAAAMDEPAAYEGEVECTVTATESTCVLLSDDGVLRPGDEGEAVTELQQGLIALGYFSAPTTGVYDTATRNAVREFQRDYRLTRDGIAGPNTQGLLATVLDGSSNIVLASQFGIGTVLMNTNAPQAIINLQTIFGAPDSDTGWQENACDGAQWRQLRWGGFRAVFTNRTGTALFDGWWVDGLGNVPSWLYFKGGFRQGTTWGYVKGLPGAVFDTSYGGFFRVTSLGYGNGRFTVAYPADPPDSAVVAKFGTGTGAFVSC